MFSVKATYRNETRKFTFSTPSFPSYDEIWTQLFKVFPIDNDVYLSQLIFSPFHQSRLLVGIEVHTEAQYNARIAPFVGVANAWPRGMLKFTVVDKPALTLTQQRDRLQTAEPTRHPSSFGTVNPTPSDFYPFAELDETVAGLRHAVSDASVPRRRETTSASQSQNNRLSMVSQNSCCSVSASKEEMKELMDGFLKGCGRIVSSLESENLSTPRQSSISTVPMDQDVSVPQPQPVNLEAPLRIPGSFAQPNVMVPVVPGSTPVNFQDKPLHPDVWCNFCRQEIRGVRSKCNRCADYDLCEKCIANKDAIQKHKSMNWRAEHSFFTIDPPSSPAPKPDTTMADQTSTSEPELKIHQGIVCDMCNETVVGLRHKCLDCPDYDLCNDCRPNAYVVHDRNHEFFVIEEPGRVIVHTVFNGDEYVNKSHGHSEVPGHRGGNPRGNNCAPDAAPDAAPVPAAAVVPREVVHNAVCNLCSGRITNTRYKCVDCPDYDTCATCYIIASEQHPRHVFVKLIEAQHLVSDDPARTVAHPADCDGCGQSISGVRFKCMHPDCPDYDLCANCEALPIAVHPDTHPMLKMKNVHTVIPTVYRVGGTKLIDAPVQTPAPPAQVVPIPVIPVTPVVTTAEASVMAEAPVPEKVEVAVQQSQPEPSVQDRVDADGRIILPLPVEMLRQPMESFVPYSPQAIEMELPKQPVHLPEFVHASPPWRCGTSYVNTLNLPYNVPAARAVPLPRPRVISPPATSMSHMSPMLPVNPFARLRPLVPMKSDSPAGSNAPIRTVSPVKPISPMRSMIPLAPVQSSLFAKPPSPQLVAAPTCVYNPPPVPNFGRIHFGPRPSYEPPQAAPSPTPPTIGVPSTSVSVLPPATPAPSTLFSARSPVEPPRLVNNVELRAVFVSDNNIQDGQIFPAGAEFLKSWLMRNNGDVAWPESTEIVFVAGDRMAAREGAPIKYNVGTVAPGASVDVSVGDMKAPDVPGKYVSYWRLNDGVSKPFGASVWCDITVAEPEIFNSMTISDTETPSIHGSLSSSSMLMPPHAPMVTNPEVTEPENEHEHDNERAYAASQVPSSPAYTSSTLPSQDDDEGSVSILDTSDSDEDLIDWDETHSRAPSSAGSVHGDVEYVML